MIGQNIAAAVRVEWSELREEAAWAGLRPRRRRRRILRGLVACVLATLAVLAWPRSHPQPDHPVAHAQPAVEASPLAERPHEAATTREHDVVDLVRGTRRFEATPSHVLEVHSGHVTVEAYDAVFACSHSEDDTHVEVYRGSIVVRAAGQRRELVAGEHGDYAEVPPPAARPTWRELAHDGDYDRAYRAVEHVQDRTEDLVLAADVMRLSHHPEEAVSPLRRVIAEHPDDPRASLAAFTLGRVLLDELGRPGEAAAAFADCTRLAPDGPLAEDAVARGVEALSRAGDAAAAKQLAADYLRRFPDGRRLHSVRKFGGLE